MLISLSIYNCPYPTLLYMAEGKNCGTFTTSLLSLPFLVLTCLNLPFFCYLLFIKAKMIVTFVHIVNSGLHSYFKPTTMHYLKMLPHIPIDLG